MKEVVVRYAFVEEMVVKYAFVVYDTHFSSLGRYQGSDYGGRQRSAGPSVPNAAAFVGGGGWVATCDFGGAPTK